MGITQLMERNYMSVNFCQNMVRVSRKSNKNYILLNIYLMKMQNLTDLLNPFRAAGEKSLLGGTSSSHGGQEKSTEKHQLVSEGISQEPGILSSHMGPQKIAERISFHITTNDMMVAEQV